ncbi:MAG: OFA family MFS transporter [Eubacteriales bacterium]
MTTENKNENNYIRWIYVLVGIMIMMFLGTVYSYGVFREPIEDIYNIGTTLSGLPYMISLAFYALFMFFSGRVLSQIKPRKAIAIGGLVISAGWILSSLAWNIFVLTITYGIIIGSGVGIVYGVPMQVVAKWFPKKKGFAVGLVLLGFGLSPFITAPAARILIENFGLEKTFLILGIFFGIAIPVLGLLLKFPSEKRVYETRKETKNKGYEVDIKTMDMIKTSTFKGLYINFTIGTMIGLTLIGLTSMIGTDLIGISSVNVAFFISLFAIFNGIGRPIFGWLTDKFSSKKTMNLSYILIIIASMLMILANKGSTFFYGLSFSIYWLNLGGWLAIAPTSTIKIFGIKNYSENYGVVFTAYGIGALVGVASSGIILDYLGSYNYLFYYIILLSVLGIFITKNLIKD